MITLDHIKQLDRKVHKAVDEINTLRAENKMLMEDLDKYQHRIEELEIMINTFKEDQSEIENGIIDAITQLDLLEDSIAVTSQDTEPQNETVEKPTEPVSEETETEGNNSDHSEKTPTEEESSEKGESELDIF